MDKYLKMADVFGGAEVVIRKDAASLVDCCGVLAANCLCPETAAHIAHAINSHDELVENVLHYEADALMWERRAVTEASRAQELVAEVERLRMSSELAIITLEEVDRVLTEKIKNGAYDFDDISGEVAYALERLSENE